MGRCIYLRKGEVHTPPVVGVKAGDLPIGQIVKLMEGGVETEFIVVNQGIPENSGLYDASCNGTWLLRKDIKENRQWNSSNVNDYANSTIHSYLNGTFLGLFDANTQSIIKQVKVPYRQGSGASETVTSGENGLSAKIFLLSGAEVGLTSNDASHLPNNEGAKLNYFESGTGTSAKNKRIAYLSTSAASWWLRSPVCLLAKSAYNVLSDGSANGSECSYSHGVRPALIIPSTSIFDPTTYLLKK